MTDYVRNGTEDDDNIQDAYWNSNDFISSNLYGGNDTFAAWGGAYLVYGGDGNDQLYGGGGGGTAYGGAGNDMLVAYYGNGDTDRMYGGAGNDEFFGPSSETLIGHHYFYGGDGVDFLRTGVNGGDDHLFGGTGYDVFLTSGSGDGAGVGVSLATGGFSGKYVIGDTYSGVEGLKGTDYADELIGNASGNALVGAKGADVLRGAEGDDLLIGYDFVYFFENFTSRRSLANQLSITDTQAFEGRSEYDDSAVDQLFGGTGNDVLIGGYGADVLDGGTGFDTAGYMESWAGVTVDLATGATGGGSAAGDTFTSVENLIGSINNDSLTGDGGANRLRGLAGDDQLYGAGGNDIFEGGKGADQMYGGAGIDTVSYYRAAGGVSVDLSLYLAQYTGAAEGWDTLSSIQNLNGSKYGDDVRAGSGNNSINGYDGDDTIRGAGGNDTLLGWTGNDTLYGGAGRDTLTGGAGGDTFAFAALSESALALSDRVTDYGAGDKLDLSAIDANGVGAGNGTFSRIADAAAFSARGQMRISQQGADTWVELNTDLDADAEARIILTGAHNQAGVESGWAL